MGEFFEGLEEHDMNIDNNMMVPEVDHGEQYVRDLEARVKELEARIETKTQFALGLDAWNDTLQASLAEIADILEDAELGEGYAVNVQNALEIATRYKQEKNDG